MSSVATQGQRSDFEQAILKLKPLPRSERVRKLFNFEATDYQSELIDHSEEEPKAQSAPKAGRQVGKTLTAGVVGADHAVCAPTTPTDVLFTAPGQATADEMFRECKNHFRNSDFTLEQFGVAKDNTQTWEFTNGTRILSRTLGDVDRDDSSGNRGMSPSCVIVDEAAYSKDAVYTEEIEEFFITHPEYEYILISTPAGKSGYFYNAVEGTNSDDWFSPHWPTRISPYAQQDFIEKKRGQLDTQTFRQEYLGEFVETEDAYFPYELVKSCIAAEPPSRTPGADVFLGVDVARSGSDRTVYTPIDTEKTVFEIAAEETSTMPSIVGRIKALDEQYGFSGILIDENAVGGGVVDFANEAPEIGRKTVPVTFTTKSKQTMYRGLKKAFEAGSIRVPKHDRLIHELTSLRYDFTVHGKLRVQHPPGGHDDFPDSLALAHMGVMKASPSQSSDGGIRSF